MRYHVVAFIGVLLCPAWARAQTTSEPFTPQPQGASASMQTGADANVSVDRWAGRPLTLEGHVGIGMPLGFVGAGVDYSPVRWFAAGAGVGASEAGPQAATNARFRIPVGDSLGIGLGGGLSAGKYQWVEGGVFSVFVDDPASKMWRPAYWGNVEISLEGRSRKGFAIRGYVGRGALLNGGDGECKGDSSTLNHCLTVHREDGKVRGYAGLAMGYAFSL